MTVVKQCDSVLTTSALKPQIEGVEAVLSLACGIGPQMVAELFPDLIVLPGQNTHFMGEEDREGGKIEARCIGCGDCILTLMGGVCPHTRVLKSLLNGACGGARSGKCELARRGTAPGSSSSSAWRNWANWKTSRSFALPGIIG